MNNIGENIIFYLEEKTDESDNSNEIKQMLYELEETDDIEEIMNYNLMTNEDDTSIYDSTKKLYDDKYGMNNEEFYEEYTIKELLRICNYYDIEKNIKMAKYKKQDIISSVVYFESLPENNTIVLKRHKLWSYIIELKLDPKMKKYVLWG